MAQYINLLSVKTRLRTCTQFAFTPMQKFFISELLHSFTLSMVIVC